MKKFNLIDIITMLGIAASILLVLMFASGCSMKFYKQSPEDVRKCCDRVDARTKEMSQFNRYCKVALFLSNSKVKSIGKGVKENAATAVKVCKFVFKVETDEELVAAGDEQEYYRVRSYIIKPDENFWRQSLPCDPQEPACEEF
jgi:hypothetical protein